MAVGAKVHNLAFNSRQLAGITKWRSSIVGYSLPGLITWL